MAALDEIDDLHRRDAAADAPRLCGGFALFLDFDGTLVEFCDRPEEVCVDGPLHALLERARTRVGGALALISGRPIDQLESRLVPLRLGLAGLHGLQIRLPDGQAAPLPHPPILRESRRRLCRVIGDVRGVWIEDKGASLAVHYRQASAHGDLVVRAASAELERLGAGFRLLSGADVVELVPRDADKGRAVEAFMRAPPYQGRKPVFIGDDVTDLDGFAAARRLGGFGIAVGPRVFAEYRLPDVSAVRRWLDSTAGGVDG